MRDIIEDEIERQINQLDATQRLVDLLIALLDAIDGDSDLEPSLGALERPAFGWGWGIDRQSTQLAWGTGARDDREADGCIE